jgi:hypothetical protein
MMTTCAMQGRKAGDVVKLLKNYQEKTKTDDDTSQTQTVEASVS